MKRGRKKVAGHRHNILIEDDVWAWCKKNGGSQYISDTIRVVMAVGKKAKEAALMAREINDQKGGNNGN